MPIWPYDFFIGMDDIFFFMDVFFIMGFFMPLPFARQSFIAADCHA